MHFRPFKQHLQQITVKHTSHIAKKKEQANEPDVYFQVIVGLGKYAVARAEKVLESMGVKGSNVRVEYLAHPSPASASTNKLGWDNIARKQLADMGIMHLLRGEEEK